MKNTTLAFMENVAQTFAWESNLGYQCTQLFNLLDNVLFFVKDSEGKFVACNDSFAKAMGVNGIEELLGKTDYDFFTREIAEGFVKDDLSVLFGGEVVKNRMEILPNSMQSFDWVVSNKIPLKNREGKVIGLAGITTKISTNTSPIGCPPEVYQVIDYINSHYMKKITLTDLSEISHISVRSLERYFKNNFQTTFRKYLHQVRMNSVCRDLVYSNEEISKIARDNGYFDQSHLTAIFSKSLGLTPRQYRMKHGQGVSSST